MAIYLDLPYPPTVNHYWGQSGKRRFLGKKGVEFREEVIKAFRRSMQKSVDGRLSVHIDLFPPDRRIRDIDNVVKAIFDACQHAECYENDSMIDELHIVRREIVKGGACVIAIISI